MHWLINERALLLLPQSLSLSLRRTEIFIWYSREILGAKWIWAISKILFEWFSLGIPHHRERLMAFEQYVMIFFCFRLFWGFRRHNKAASGATFIFANILLCASPERALSRPHFVLTLHFITLRYTLQRFFQTINILVRLKLSYFSRFSEYASVCVCTHD